MCVIILMGVLGMSNDVFIIFPRMDAFPGVHVCQLGSPCMCVHFSVFDSGF